MSKLAIRVENLSKVYRLGGPRERYWTPRDQVSRLPSASFKAVRGRGERSEQNPAFWALKDVSFEVRPGDVVGVIGGNGAGKSTLLKILSRITEPTAGAVDIDGRVGSLLEVGTGFHAELTGRENVYLNGAILGMRRAEVARAITWRRYTACVIGPACSGKAGWFLMGPPTKAWRRTSAETGRILLAAGQVRAVLGRCHSPKYPRVWKAIGHPSTTYDAVESAVSFEITASPTPGRTFPHTRDHGWVVPHAWMELCDT